MLDLGKQRGRCYRYCYLVVAFALTSCSMQTRTVKPPGIKPSVAAEAAIAAYDQDGDQQLTAKEIERSAMTLEKWDADASGALSQAEIEERLNRYINDGVGMIGLGCQVTLGRTPLPDAEVVFEPEPWLADYVHTARGTTDENGLTMLAMDPESRSDPALEAVEIGLYRVRITHPQVKLRAEFNTETKLSYEVSPLEDLVPPTYRVRP